MINVWRTAITCTSNAGTFCNGTAVNECFWQAMSYRVVHKNKPSSFCYVSSFQNSYTAILSSKFTIDY